MDMRKALRLLVLVGVLLSWAAIAAARPGPQYQDSEPDKGEAVHEAPDEVRISFNSPLDPSSSMTVTDECQRRVSGNTTAAGLDMSAPITRDPSGLYTVSYTAKGLGGTGTTNGSFVFEVHTGPSCDGTDSGHHHHGGGTDGSTHHDHSGSGDHHHGGPHHSDGSHASHSAHGEHAGGTHTHVAGHTEHGGHGSHLAHGSHDGHGGHNGHEHGSGGGGHDHHHRSSPSDTGAASRSAPGKGSSSGLNLALALLLPAAVGLGGGVALRNRFANA